jgi:hypothetical protein
MKTKKPAFQEQQHSMAHAAMKPTRKVAITFTFHQIHRIRDFLNQEEIHLRSLANRHPQSVMYKRDADELVELIGLFYHGGNYNEPNKERRQTQQKDCEEGVT